MAIDPITGTLTAGTMIGNMLMQGQARQDALRQSQETARMIAEMNRMAQATRVDAYGNVQRYNPDTNTWEIDLTPTQERLVKAGEREQGLSLTEDATRNRTIKRRAADRGREATEDFNDARTQMRFDNPQSEQAIQDELVKLMSLSASSRRRQEQGRSARYYQRMGQGNGTYSSSGGDSGGVDTIADILLKARSGAMNEYAQRVKNKNADVLPRMQMNAQLMDAGGDAPLRFSTTPDQLASQQQNAMNGIIQAMSSGITGANASNAILAKMGNGLDLRGGAAMYSALNGGKAAPAGVKPVASSTSYTAPDEPNWDDWSNIFS